MKSPQTLAIAVLAALALYFGVTLLTRLHEGRCRIGGGGIGRASGRSGLDCGYPAGTFRPWP
jgi:hypothetical protein